MTDTKDTDHFEPLRTRAHRDRQAALGAFKRRIDGEKDRAINELNRRHGELLDNHAAALACAEAAIEAHKKALDQALASEIVAALDPLMVQFPDAPRTASAAIAKA